MDPEKLAFQTALQSGPELLHRKKLEESLDDLFVSFEITRGNLDLVREMLRYKGYDYGQHYYKRETE